MNEGVGQRLRRLRRERGLSQQELAGDGITASYISLIEAGKRQPTAKTLERLAEALGVAPEHLRDGTDSRVQDARLALRYAQLALGNGEPSDAASRFQELVAASDAQVAAEAQWGLAAALEAQGLLEPALAAYDRVYEQATASPEAQPMLRAAIAVSRCARELGDLGRAVDIGEQALALAVRWKADRTDLAVDLLCTLAFAYQERGDAVRATELLTRVRRLADELGGPRARGAVYWNASVLAGELGNSADAVGLAERALALFGEGDDERNLARLRGTHATLLLRSDPRRAAEAVGLLQAAVEKLHAAGTSLDVAYCETELSRALTLTGDVDAALDTAVSALDRLGDETRLEAARSRLALAYALAASGRHDEAVAQYSSAASAMESLGARRQAALAWAELSAVYAAVADTSAALTAARRALDLAAVKPPFPYPLRDRNPARSEPVVGAGTR